jgi:periplasmic protein TonB
MISSAGMTPATGGNMERPSHRIATLQFHTGSRRLGGLGLSFSMQALFALVLISGFVIEKVKPNPGTRLTPADEKVEVRTPPPPEPQTIKPTLPSAAPPIFTIETAPAGPTITTIVPQTGNPPVTVPPQPPRTNTVPDRAAASIAATHSSPPYPPMARRLGVEGKVTLRLTILADGRVGKADVVSSSGRRDLDEAAQSWIVSRWTYQPAIKDGAPAASQALAAVEFSLTNP